MAKHEDTSAGAPTQAKLNREWLDALHGKSIRFSFHEGPTKGTSYDHTFAADGTVTWHDPAAKKSATPDATEKHAEPPTKYGSFHVADDVYVVSYLSKSGYTLTVALNFETDELFGFASNDENWYPVRGVFEILG